MSALTLFAGRPRRRPASIVPAVLVALTLLAAVPAHARQTRSGQAQGRQASSQRAEGSLELYAYTLKHRQAIEALTVIQPMLSSEGTVELRPQDNTLVIRDRSAQLRSIVNALRGFDQPPRNLAIEVMVVEARRAPYSPAPPETVDLPPQLRGRLQELLPYSTYRVVARTVLNTREGEAITYEIGGGFEVRFRSGTVQDGRQLRLEGFRLARSPRPGSSSRAEKPLLQSSLSLRMNNYLALGLAARESSSSALMVVLNPHIDNRQHVPGAAER